VRRNAKIDASSKSAAIKVATEGPAETARTASAKTEALPGVTRVNPWKRVVVWFLGVIIAALIPFVWVSQSSRPGDGGPNIYQLLGSGELYLVSIIVLIAGLTEIVLLFSRIKYNLTVAIIVLSAFIFAYLFTARYAGASSVADASLASSSSHSVTYLSLAAFAISALHSSICVLLAAGVE
jgi:hypothetical protein